MDFSLREIGLDDTDGWQRYVGHWNAATRRLGGPGSNQLDADLQQQRRREMDPRRRPRTFLALVDDMTVGHLEVRANVLDSPITGSIEINVLPEHARVGVGGALLQVGEDALADMGATHVAAWCFHADGGDADFHEAGVRFAREHGYRLVQKEVIRELALPATFSVQHDPNYRIEVVHGVPPESWLPGLALMKERMATDAPAGDKEVVEEHWDVERARESFRAIPGLTEFYGAAFAPDGSMAGYTQVGCNYTADETQRSLLHQGDTLVIAEHRGHGLGASLKAATIAHAQERCPGLRISRTTNAESNVPMIAINEALGFVVTGWILEMGAELVR